MNPNGILDKGLLLERSEQMPYFTDLRLIFKALNNRQIEFNWLITDLECDFCPPDFQSCLPGPPILWLSGAELTRIVQQYDIQFQWAVLSGFAPDVLLDLGKLVVKPYADGNAAVWLPNSRIQHPLAQVEIICWDASATLFRSLDTDLLQRFQAFFSEAIDLDRYNEKHA